MFGRIIKINDRGALVELAEESLNNNFMGLHLILESGELKVVCEIDEVDGNILNTHFIGEIINNVFNNG